MQQSEQKHIVVDERGRAFIEGTGFKVRELVKDYQAYGWSPEELAWQHPPLTLVQVHAALAYYYEHQEAFDREIQEGLELFDRLRAENLDSPVRAKVLRVRRMRANANLPQE